MGDGARRRIRPALLIAALALTAAALALLATMSGRERDTYAGTQSEDGSARPEAGAVNDASEGGASGLAGSPLEDGRVIVDVDAQTPVLTPALAPGRGSLERTVSVRGRVVDADGSPIATARIIARNSWKKKCGHAYSRRDGSFVVSVPEDELVLEVSKRGHVPATHSLMTTGKKRVSDVEVVLQGGLVVTGMVVAPNGKPVDSGRVRLEWKSGGPDAPRPPARHRNLLVTVQEDGTFRASGLFAGEYDVKARVFLPASPAKDDADRALPSPKRRTTWASESVTLGPFRPSAHVDLHVQAGFHVAGRAVNDLGWPVQEPFRVQAKCLSGEDPWQSRTRVLRAFQSDAGTFVVEGLWPGEWSIIARRSKSITSHPVRVVAGSSPAEIELALPRAAGLRGTVSSQGDAVSSAFVSVRTPWNQLGTSTERDGSFRIKELPAGAITITVKRTGYAAYEDDVWLNAGKVKDVGVIELTPDASVASEFRRLAPEEPVR